MYTNLANFTQFVYTKMTFLWMVGGHDRVFVSIVAAPLWYYTPLVPLSSHHGPNQPYLLHFGSASWNIHHSLFSTSFTAHVIQPTLLNQPWRHSTDIEKRPISPVCHGRIFKFWFSRRNIQFMLKNFSKNIKNKKSKNRNSRHDILETLLLSKCLVISVKIGQAVFAESRAPWPHVEFGAVHSMKLAFYCSELQCLETICNDPQLNQGFRQYIVLLLKYQQVPNNWELLPLPKVYVIYPPWYP